MSDASRHIADAIRHRTVTPGDLTDDYIRAEVRGYTERALGRDDSLPGDEAQTAKAVTAHLTGYGALQPYLDDPSVEELWINQPNECFIARNGVSERIELALSGPDIRTIVERMLARTGRRVDLSQPFVDASLPDGSRLHVTIPDITRAHWSVNIRKFHHDIRTLDALVHRNMLSIDAAEFLRASVRGGLNLLVSGPTHAGKTTLLAALLAAGARSDRVITVEETFEIACQAPDHVAMQCRPANIEGSGEVSLRRLVKEALRMRPDRLVVGEVREAESLDLLIALNSGIPGLATIHANSAQDALLKMCTLPLLAGRNIDSRFVVPTVASCIDLVVHVERTPDGQRSVREIRAVEGAGKDGIVDSVAVYSCLTGTSGQLRPTGATLSRRARFASAGVPLPSLARPS